MPQRFPQVRLAPARSPALTPPPVGAGGAVLGAVVSWLTGRGFGRWLFAAAALLAISGVTRLIEFWITNGTGGVT